MRAEKLKTVLIDIENNIYQVNGRDVGESVHEFDLRFEDGEWLLMIEETRSFAGNVKART